MMLVNEYPVDWDYLLQPGDQVYIRRFRQPPKA
jgi:protein involved in polysaccharide export with SLBB domain